MLQYGVTECKVSQCPCYIHYWSFLVKCVNGGDSEQRFVVECCGGEIVGAELPETSAGEVRPWLLVDAPYANDRHELVPFDPEFLHGSQDLVHKGLAEFLAPVE